MGGLLPGRGRKMPAMKTAVIIIAAALSGCAGFETAHEVRATASSGLIGCPVSEIATSDHEKLTWTATCRGKVFYCTAAGNQGCAEALKPTAGR